MKNNGLVVMINLIIIFCYMGFSVEENERAPQNNNESLNNDLNTKKQEEMGVMFLPIKRI